MPDIRQIWYCAHCGFSVTIASTASAHAICPRCGSSHWQGVQPRIDSRPPSSAFGQPVYVVHVAGDPHEGLQACRQCAKVLVEHGDVAERVLAAEGAGAPGWIPRFFPAGAFVTAGPGSLSIGCDSRAITCRPGTEQLL